MIEIYESWVQEALDLKIPEKEIEDYIVKAHKPSKEELVKIRDVMAKKLKKQKKIERRDIKVQALLEKPKPKFKSLGMGLHDGIFYYGTKIYDEDGKSFDSIVTSDHKIYVNWKNHNEIRNEFGLNYRWEFFDSIIDYTWSNKSINEWLYGKAKKIKLKEIFERILEKNRYFIWYKDDRWHKWVALDILSTYFLEIFETKGRTLIKADHGSGKSKQSQIYQLLAFNSMMSADWTKSSIFRAIESTKGTPIIDNFDEIPDELKKDIMIVYRAYRKHVKSIRTEGQRKRRPMGFDLFCSMILNNILGLDEVSEDRSNIIKMLKTKDPITKRKLKFDDPGWKEIRDDCFICGLQNWELVQKTYENLNQNVLTEKELEIVEPILVLAKTISKKLFKEMLELRKKDLEQKKVKELSEDWLYNGLKSILEILKSNGAEEKWIKIKDVVDDLSPILFDMDNKQYSRKKRGLSIFLGKKFKSNPLFEGRMVQGHSEYLFNREDVIKFCKLKDFDDLVKSYSTYSTLSTYSTNSTNSTNKLKNGMVEKVELKIPILPNSKNQKTKGNTEKSSKIDNQVEKVELVDKERCNDNSDNHD